jgi:NADPH:quinone reductase-like Zn-dependent oxidoreductase
VRLAVNDRMHGERRVGGSKRSNALITKYKEHSEMARAVRFDEYGDVDVLKVVEVDIPEPGPGELLVRVKAAGVNPGEAKIRDGSLRERWPATFPSGQGSDLAGVVEKVGAGVTEFEVGDEVIGFTHNRASQAEYVVIEAADAADRPPEVPWEVAGALFVVGTTAYAAVQALKLSPSDTVVVAGAAGGVGSLAVQLARRQHATVIGLASERHHEWLRGYGVIPVAYGEGVADRIRAVAPGGVDAFFDTVGGGYVELALELGVEPGRIDTIVDFRAPEKYGVLLVGNMAGASADTLGILATLVANGELEVPIAHVYPLENVRDAYTEIEHGHTRGKIVLVP